MGCTAAEAEDLTQETFLAVLQKPFEEYSAAATTAYLRKVAYNLMVSLRRREGRMNVVPDAEQFDQDWMRWAGDDDGQDRLDALMDCLKFLTERARLALEMRFRDDASRAAIAEALEMTEHGAKNLMQRAKKQLRQCIEEKDIH